MTSKKSTRRGPAKPKANLKSHKPAGRPRQRVKPSKQNGFPVKDNSVSAKPSSSAPYGVRASSKLAIVLALLQRPNGATIDALRDATGWQAHSIRGALSSSVKKKLGLTILSVKTDGVRTYRIAE